MLRPGPPALAPLPLTISSRRQREQKRDCECICRCHYVFPLLTLLISFSPLSFASAVALAQYLPDPISLSLCFTPNVSTFSLKSASASLFFLTVCFTYLLLTPWLSLSHECCFLFEIFLSYFFKIQHLLIYFLFSSNFDYEMNEALCIHMKKTFNIP